MSREIDVTLSTTGTSAVPVTASTVWMRRAGIVLAGSALVGLCAHIVLPIPFSPVPLSMAPFAVLLLGLMLSPRLGAATLVAYLAEGAMGLPVFAPQGPGGLVHLLGPTGGYLLAYPVAVALIAAIYRRTGKQYGTAVLSALAGSLLILTCGATWLALLTHAPLHTILTLSVFPFLIGDAVKVLAAAGLAMGWQRLRRSAN